MSCLTWKILGTLASNINGHMYFLEKESPSSSFSLCLPKVAGSQFILSPSTLFFTPQFKRTIFYPTLICFIPLLRYQLISLMLTIGVVASRGSGLRDLVTHLEHYSTLSLQISLALCESRKERSLVLKLDQTS